MNDSDKLIDLLKEAVITTLGRTLDSPTDFNFLSAKIFEQTGDMISASTLKRLFGYIKPATTPRPSTLSSLARYVGYAGWSEFCEAQCLPIPAAHKHSPKRIYIAVAIIVVVAVMGVVGTIIWSNPENIDTVVAVPDSTVIINSAPVNSVEQTEPAPTKENLPSEQQKFESTLRYCIKKTEQACESARAKMSQMDASAYYHYINDFYAQYILTDLKEIIAQTTAKSFADDKLLQKRYNSEIFIQCQEIGVTLLREASLNVEAAHKKKQQEEKEQQQQQSID